MTEKRAHKIKGSYGIVDYYKHYNANYKYKVDAALYKAIVKDVNNEFFLLIADEGYELKLPRRMGIIYLSKQKTRVWMDDDGKVKTNRPINYKATNDLWKANPEAKQNKVIIRHENKHTDGYVFRVRYKKSAANYKNKSAYFIRPHRHVTERLCKNIRDGKLNTLWT